MLNRFLSRCLLAAAGFLAGAVSLVTTILTTRAPGSPACRARSARAASITARLVRPYTSGSRLPSRLRLGPCRTRMLAIGFPAGADTRPVQTAA